jgi:hypothetical protein
MATVNIRSDIYERLARKAAERNTTVEELVTPALEQLAQAEPPVAERRRALDEWLALIVDRAQRYPAGFVADDRRESIYEGRGE